MMGPVFVTVDDGSETVALIRHWIITNDKFQESVVACEVFQNDVVLPRFVLPFALLVDQVHVELEEITAAATIREFVPVASDTELIAVGQVESVFSRPSRGVSQEEVQKKTQLGTTQ
jgi:hypothetical protein